MKLKRIIVECVKSGTIASLAMMPVGFAFRAAGLRIGHYGPKFAGLYVDDPGSPLLFAQHIVLGWVSVLPLIGFLLHWRGQLGPLTIGAIYGAGYYVLINSFLLPLFFGDSLPWTLGVGTVVPSLVSHVVFGLAAGYVSRSLVNSTSAA